MSAKVIAVAGASGYVGKAVTDALLETKVFEVRVLTRELSVSDGAAVLYRISYQLALDPLCAASRVQEAGSNPARDFLRR